MTDVRPRRLCLSVAGWALLPTMLTAFPPPSAGNLEPQERRVNAAAAAMADFVRRVNEYAALHKRLDGILVEVPKQGSPEQRSEHQRALAKLVQKERANAKPGDLCTKAMRTVIRRNLATVLRGVEGKQIKRSILDEYTGSVRLAVNGHYPDTVPFSSVPPQVLNALPKLPEVLEYRFVGERLILLDVHAHVIADFVEHVFP